MEKNLCITLVTYQEAVQVLLDYTKLHHPPYRFRKNSDTYVINIETYFPMSKVPQDRILNSRSQKAQNIAFLLPAPLLPKLQKQSYYDHADGVNLVSTKILSFLLLLPCVIDGQNS